MTGTSYAAGFVEIGYRKCRVISNHQILFFPSCSSSDYLLNYSYHHPIIFSMEQFAVAGNCLAWVDCRFIEGAGLVLVCRLHSNSNSIDFYKVELLHRY